MFFYVFLELGFVLGMLVFLLAILIDYFLNF